MANNLVDRRAGFGWYRLHDEGEKKAFVAAQEVKHTLQSTGVSVNTQTPKNKN